MNITMPSNMELLAIGFTTICIILAGLNNVHNWWTGILGCIFYGIVFYDAKLYADALLQVFFVVTGVIGWKMWYSDQDKRPQRYLSWAQFGACLVFALVVTSIYSVGLYHFTDSPAPFWDSSILVFSVVAQLLLMARYVHNWPMWLLVNIISVPLYWSRGLQLSSLLYAGYLVHSIWATYHWLKLNKGSEGAYSAPTAPYKIEAP